MAKKKGLGRGINALIKEQGFEEIGIEDAVLREIPVDKISTNPYQPRQEFDKKEIENLATTIAENGLLNPITVRKKDDDFELISGERRLRAYKQLKRKTIPATVLKVADEKMRMLALIENLMREDLNAIEIARSYKSIIEDEGLSHDALAKSLGKGRATITNTVRLLELPESVKKMIVSGTLSEGHARTLLTLPDTVSRETMAKETVKFGYSVRQLEEIVKGEKTLASKTKKTREMKPARKDANIRKAEKELEELLGTKVSIHDHNGNGKIVIDYYDLDDFSRIFDIIEK